MCHVSQYFPQGKHSQAGDNIHLRNFNFSQRQRLIYEFFDQEILYLKPYYIKLLTKNKM